MRGETPIEASSNFEIPPLGSSVGSTLRWEPALFLIAGPVCARLRWRNSNRARAQRSPSSSHIPLCLHSQVPAFAMAKHDHNHNHKNNALDLLIIKQTSLARTLATAQSLHRRGQLRQMPRPVGVSLPALQTLRVRTRA